MTRYYRFDQLFEKLPSGAYRERETPAPLLSIDHRHDYFRSPTTGRICVLYPAFRLRECDILPAGTRLPTAKEYAAVIGDDTPPPLTGGNWQYGSRIDWGFRKADWNPNTSITWRGN